MQRGFFAIGTCLTLLACLISVNAFGAQADAGPLGLRWGMPKEAVEKMEIRLCCRQVGKWGARYSVDRKDIENFPRSFGDEEKVYLYFGNTDKLLRVYIAIKKIDGWNRYRQINLISGEKYLLVEKCTRKEYTKYEALKLGKREEKCKNYEAYSEYRQDDVEVFVGLEKLPTEYRVSIILLHQALYKKDKDKNNPL